MNNSSDTNVEWVRAMGCCNPRDVLITLGGIIEEAVAAVNELPDQNRKGRHFSYVPGSDPRRLIAVHYEAPQSWCYGGDHQGSLSFFMSGHDNNRIHVGCPGMSPSQFTVTPVWNAEKSQCLVTLHDSADALIASELNLSQMCQRVLGPFFFD